MADDITMIYHTNYIRNSRAVAVLWAFFVLCFAIIEIIVFIQPYWVGSTEDTLAIGHFGLYSYCTGYGISQELTCYGTLSDWSEILSSSWTAATVLVGVSVLSVLMSIVAMLLFFFCSASTVFKICGSFLVTAAVGITAGAVVYPAGWDNREFADLCEEGAGAYSLGSCEIRWAYMLAIICIFDAIILATLAFVLANRHEKLLPEHVLNEDLKGRKVPAGGELRFQETSSLHSSEKKQSGRGRNGSMGRLSSNGSSQAVFKQRTQLNDDVAPAHTSAVQSPGVLQIPPRDYENEAYVPDDGSAAASPAASEDEGEDEVATRESANSPDSNDSSTTHSQSPGEPPQAAATATGATATDADYPPPPPLPGATTPSPAHLSKLYDSVFAESGPAPVVPESDLPPPEPTHTTANQLLSQPTDSRAKSFNPRLITMVPLSPMNHPEDESSKNSELPVTAAPIKGVRFNTILTEEIDL